MILKKHIKKIEIDLLELGCSKEDFSLQQNKTENIIKFLTIKFRDTPFEFSIRESSSDDNQRFLFSYVAFTSDYKVKTPARFLYPNDFKQELRNWIRTEINAYLEENGVEPISLTKEKIKPIRQKSIADRINKLFIVDNSNGININLSKGLFWTVAPVLIGGSFALGLYFGQAKFDKEKIEYYNSIQRLSKELGSKNEIILENELNIKELKDSLKNKVLN